MPEKLLNRAMSLEYGCGRRDLAIRDLTRAIEQASGWAEAYDWRAMLYRKERRWDEAIADYTRAIEVAPKWGTLYNNRAVVYGRTDRNQEALADYGHCLELGADDWIVRSNRAQVLVKLNRGDEAFAEIDRVAQMYPDKSHAERIRAETLKELGRAGEALAAYDAAVAKEPSNANLLVSRARLLALTPEGCERALADLEKAQSLSPQFDPDLFSNISLTLAGSVARSCPERFDSKAALAMAEQALKMDPDESYYLAIYGLALYRDAQYPRAAGVLQHCVDTYDGLPGSTVYFTLAMSHQRSGQAAKARAAYQRGLERLQKTYPKDPILLAVRDEAAEVLGMKSPS